ncbi:uncharacterized protein LOC141847424 isoform X1 [Curcuma longa]|uniref:uncharacterized protein LOC141847424 isoform X1 n=1 Tax=Curcuma longa TaxID=136217 RepID=UPI003D9F51E0
MEEEEEKRKDAEETLYKTKVVHFLGRETPIVLQNDNGPCPLLAICNVLLLRNNISLSLDASEVSLQKLLSLVAERLIDSNSNVQDKGDEYVNNQQQNISDAIDLLPRLATGIDVNLHFRKIDDFEFTRECAIFDLLDIGLYHGWIVDPQDVDTAAAIGSKSYNTLVAELVAFEARRCEADNEGKEEGDCVDFVASTTATLGVPSPSLSRGRSFDDHWVSNPGEQPRSNGNIQEEEELMKALNLPRAEVSEPSSASMPGLDGKVDIQISTSQAHADALGIQATDAPHTIQQLRGTDDIQEEEKLMKALNLSKAEVSELSSVSMSGLNGKEHIQIPTSEACVDSSVVEATDVHHETNQSVSQGCNESLGLKENMSSEDGPLIANETTEIHSDSLLFNEATEIHRKEEAPEGPLVYERYSKSEEIGTAMPDQAPNVESSSLVSSDRCCSYQDLINVSVNGPGSLSTDAPSSLQSSNGKELSEFSEISASSIQEHEPIYEGEETIFELGILSYANREPVYEGEIVLAEQAEKKEDCHTVNTRDVVDHKQWQLMKNFLEHNASQLTIYGLFCLQEDLKERELCVFFRNNHFSTMFKFNGELYLLATDQGYMNQPDLVWEKLNEVNGDTVFMTGYFTEFKVDNQVHDSWNEQSAVTSTADYLAELESSDPSSSAFSSDLQLAIALQQQEFEQQPQQQQQQQPQQPHSQPSSGTGRSKLTTGPPSASRNSGAFQRSESKTKEKCCIM